MKNLYFEDINSAKKALNSGRITQKEYNNWLEDFNYYSIQSMEDKILTSQDDINKKFSEIKNQSIENHSSMISEINKTKSELIENKEMLSKSIIENNALKEEIKQNQIYQEKTRIDESKMPKIREI
jgi:hypothetical protein